ncbi:MAG TPA: twin-arginine translocase TatA/TatE family subunit [Ktedonobacterales bacterium]|jgi:sec-independent protein translocase protein TatA
MFGGFHWYDLIPLALIALLIWGPKRLPEMGSSIGKTIKEFQKSMRDVKEPEAPPTSAIPPTTPAATPELPSAAPVSATTETPKE